MKFPTLLTSLVKKTLEAYPLNSRGYKVLPDCPTTGDIDPERPKLIMGEKGMVISPRVQKSKENQTDRSKDMAEVFTPSWICDAQNNLVEDALPKDMTWQNYVRLNCLEITCGEAPYLVSRYDATTGEPIPLERRIGLLDRKLLKKTTTALFDIMWEIFLKTA